MMNYSTQDTLVAYATDIEKRDFYYRTYHHVAFAILGFVVVEGILLKTVPMEMISSMLSGKFVWMILLGLFWLGSMLSQSLSLSMSREMQYLGLVLMVVLEAIIFLPILSIATYTIGADVILQAAIITLAMFAGLTAVAFWTKSDFSFLRTFIIVGGFASIGLLIAGMLLGFNLGLWFSAGMILLAIASILYQTGQLKDSFLTSQYVGAALVLFSSIMLLFWYVLRILMNSRR